MWEALRLYNSVPMFHLGQSIMKIHGSPRLSSLSFILSNQTANLSRRCASTSTQSSSDKKNSAESKQNAEVVAGDVHFKLSEANHPLGNENVKKLTRQYWDNPIPHAIYKDSDLKVDKTHYSPGKLTDRVALFAVKCMRGGFDIASRYKGPGGEMTKRDWLNRCLFLETVAGVPGMVAGMCRHLKSLRSMQRDYGWIHTLLEEAENERMHLLIFMKMKDPGLMFRMMVIGAQGVFFNMFFLTYLVAPKVCHRFVGYLEEEAVKTYSGLLEDLDGPEHLQRWRDEPAHQIAINYYKLNADATVKDVIKCVRADEAHHRDVNHTFADLDYELDPNPFLQKRLKESKKP